MSFRDPQAVPRVSRGVDASIAYRMLMITCLVAGPSGPLSWDASGGKARGSGGTPLGVGGAAGNEAAAEAGRTGGGALGVGTACGNGAAARPGPTPGGKPGGGSAWGNGPPAGPGTFLGPP